MYKLNERTKIYRSIEREILSSILHGRVHVGEGLPTESALMVEHGASRVSVRRALSELKDQGIISSTAGRGTQVLSREGGFGCALDFVVLIAPVHSPFFSSMMAPLDHLAAKRGAVLLYKHDFDGKMLQSPDFYLKLLERGARNLVLWPHVPQDDWSLLDRLRSVGMNIVVVDQEHETAAADVVALDSDRGMQSLVQEIRSRSGNGPLWMLAHDPHLPSEHSRQDAFRKSAGDEHKVCLAPRLEDDAHRDAFILQLIKDSLEESRPPVGFVCSNGGLGLAAARAVSALRKELVVGTFDYIDTMEEHTLIALKQPIDAMARATFESLVKQSRYPKQWRASTLHFEGEIIVTGEFA